MNCAFKSANQLLGIPKGLCDPVLTVQSFNYFGFH